MEIQWAPHDAQLQQALMQALIGQGTWSPALLHTWQTKQMTTNSWSIDQLCSCQFLGAGYDLLSSEQLQVAAQHWEQQLRSATTPLARSDS